MNNITTAWQEYQRGIEFKRKIDYYNTIDENYRYFQGDQWGDTQSEGLPTPVFNIIKPVILYKVSMIMQNETKIMYNTENSIDKDYPHLNEVTHLLSQYSETLWDKLKMDFNNEMLLQEGALTGNGFAYFYIDEDTGGCGWNKYLSCQPKRSVNRGTALCNYCIPQKCGGGKGGG